MTETVSAPRQEVLRGPARRGSRVRSTAALLAVGLLVGVAGTWALRPLSEPPPVVRSLLDVQPAAELDAGGSLGVRGNRNPGGSRTALAWVPGERALVFVGRSRGVQRLYVRRLDARAARPIEGTDGAQVPTVSPDGQSVAFWADGVIRRVPLSGGPAAVVARTGSSPPFGMSWGPDGTLYLGHPDGRSGARHSTGPLSR